MKKIVFVLILLIATAILVGCSNIKNVTNTKTELVYEALSQKDEYIINLTGNKILTYKLENLPADKKYEIMLTYEVYENSRKVKEDNIFGIIQDEFIKKEEDRTIGINLQEGRIRTLISSNGSYASGQYDVKEDLANCFQAYLTTNVPLEIGKEIYIYYATFNSSIKSNIPLGVPISDTITNSILEDSKSTILIKLSFKDKE